MLTGRLFISLLGHLNITLHGQAIDSFEYNKVKALLAYLVAEAEHPQRRGALAGILWPDQTERAALDSLRNSLSKLRHAICDAEAQPPYLLITKDTIQFNPASDYRLDSNNFSQLLAACKNHRHRRIESCPRCIDRLKQAVSLYRGEFLEGFHVADSSLFDDWVRIKREKYSQLALEALQKLAVIHEWRGEWSQALQYTGQQLVLDPFLEEAHTRMMRLLATTGQRTAAMKQYEKLRALLRNELEVEPTDETQHLYEEIKYGSFQAAPDRQKLRINNLPLSLTSFVGRKRELDEISAMIENPDCHLLTLVGPGGAGKTRLAQMVAAHLIDGFPNGACFVPLAAIDSAEFIIPAILEALQVKQAERANLKEQLITYLKDKELILILDNFEQLVEGAGLIGEILQKAPGVMVLVTSRIHLSLQAEWLYDVTGLSYPLEETIHDPSGYEAVQLFSQRLFQLMPRLPLTEKCLHSAAQICQLVDGMPLGIELAVSSVRIQSIEQIAREIQNRKDDLAASWPDVAERHRSLRYVFDHSWRLLNEQEKNIFRSLAVFRGGFSLEAAKQVTKTSKPLLDKLVDHSLVRYYPQTNRYYIIETLRQYALEKLADSGMEKALNQLHLSYFIDLAEECYARYHKKLLWSELNQLSPEMDNCRAALEWCFSANLMEAALQLAGALGDYWFHFGHGIDAETWIMKILESKYPFKRTHNLARIYLLAGFIIKNRDMKEGREYLEKAQTIWQELGDEENVAIVYKNLYYLPLMHGEYDTAVEMLEQALKIFEKSGNEMQIASTMNDLADVYLVYDTQEGIEKALSLGEQALAIDRRIGRTSVLHWDLSLLGHISMRQKNYQQARIYLEEAVAQVDETHNEIELSEIFTSLGSACYFLGDYESARNYYERRLKITSSQSFGFRDLCTLCVLSYLVCRQGELDLALFYLKEVFHQLDAGGDTCLAVINGFIERLPWVLVACGEPESAAILYGFTDAMRENQKASLPNYLRSEFERDLAETRRMLGDDLFIKKWTEGRVMTLNQAKTCALEAKLPVSQNPRET